MRLTPVQKRNGFTLIELLVVIAIIAILMALTLGVMSRVFAFLDETKVVNEVNKLSESCNLFKSTFGRYPPSKIILCENGTTYGQIISGSIPPPGGSGLSGPQWQALGSYSVEYLNSIFPGNSLALNNWDGSLNASGVPTLDGPGTYQLLEGHRCLVFFLGGIRYNGALGIGFNTDKSNPTAGSTGARLGPFFEFDAGRIAAPTDPFPYYKDIYGTSYAYFASKVPGMNNYPNSYLPVGLQQPSDCYTLTTFSTTIGPVSFVPYFVGSVPPGTPPTSWPTATAFKFHKPDTFQIVSAGKDKLWGTGGHYDQTNGELSLFLPPALVANVDAEALSANYDNITNVSGGRVVPK